MQNTRNVEWLKHLFRYRHQLRTESRVISPSDLDVLLTCAALVLTEQRPSAIRIARENTMMLPCKPFSAASQSFPPWE